MNNALTELAKEHDATKEKLENVANSKTNTEGLSEVVDAFNREPGSKFLVSGYSSAGFVDRQNDTSTFNANLNPGLHFRLFEDLHVNSELEITLNDEEKKTDVELEFVQADFFAHDNLILSAGKMLTPFNAFSERIHPSWINKLPSLPPIYGAHGGGGVSPGIIPVLTDVGVQARGGYELGESRMLNYAIYLVNGPEAEDGDAHGDEEEAGEEDGHDDDEAADEHEEELARSDGGGEESNDLVELEFGENFRDQNNNKTIG
jgi:hypothetical protein